jgi:hypothetical protein
MHRLGLAVLLGLATIGAVAAQGNAPLFVEGKGVARTPTPALTADAQAQQVMDAATAAALIGALQTRFQGQDVELQLGTVRSERASLRDIALQGEARIRFAEAQAWLPIRFEALYDTSGQIVESPNIVLGATLASPRTAASLPLKGLQTQVAAAMTEEFASQQVEFALNDARVVGDDGTRMVVQGGGVANFEGEDRVPVTVHALYDRSSGRWMDPQYALQGS